MSFDNAISALSIDALKFVKDGQVIGLGSGRAATAFVKALSIHIQKKGIQIKCVPTSLQIKIIAQQNKIPTFLAALIKIFSRNNAPPPPLIKYFSALI